MNADLERLLDACLPNLAATIKQEIVRPIKDFRNDTFPRLVSIDSQIPGIGMQFTVWKGITPYYPFSP